MGRRRAEEVAAHVAERAAWGWSRSSGPGGQRRDHAETRAELTIDAGALEGLPEAEAARLAAAWHLATRPLRLISQAERSRERNRVAVLARLERLVAAALAPPPPTRRPTRPTRASAERRLSAKARRSSVKSHRRAPVDEG